MCSGLCVRAPYMPGGSASSVSHQPAADLMAQLGSSPFLLRSRCTRAIHALRQRGTLRSAPGAQR